MNDKPPRYKIYRTGNENYLLSTVMDVVYQADHKKTVVKKPTESSKAKDPVAWRRVICIARRLRVFSVVSIVLATSMKMPEFIVLSIILFAFSLAITVETKTA
ncbi:MAG TPA: hypothetical protein ENI98_10060 [Gammaproteobacteria bacterium]|nr:hypothetical protein [Gammaproteobacteria bacterium]